MSALALVVVSAAIVVALVATQHFRNASRWQASEPLPEDLRRAKLFVSEKDYSIRRPFPLVGRPDQVYRVGRRLIVTDTKRRGVARVFQGDRIQLSLYRLLLERSVNPWWRRWILPYTVEHQSWLRCMTPEGVTYVRVDTIPDSELIELYERYRAVQCRETPPRPTTSTALCRGCNYRDECSYVANPVLHHANPLGTHQTPAVAGR